MYLSEHPFNVAAGKGGARCILLTDPQDLRMQCCHMKQSVHTKIVRG